MTSAGTKRRTQRDAELLAQWTGTTIGTKVTVHRANGSFLKTVTLSDPFSLHAGAYVRVQGIAGNTHLRRVTRGWDTAPEPEHTAEHLPWNASAEMEIQRLRVAMVHAMDDAEWIAMLPDARADVKRRASRALEALRAALEKR